MNPRDDFHIFKFCQNCSVEEFKEFIATNSDVLKSDSVLDAACVVGNIKLLQYLFTANETSNYRDKYYWQLNEKFCQSAFAGRLESIVYLLTSKDLITKADLSYNDNDAFRTACSQEHVQIVHYFLKQGIHLSDSTQDWLNETPFRFIYDEAKTLFDIEQNFEYLTGKLEEKQVGSKKKI